jgi:hypothetical protein
MLQAAGCVAAVRAACMKAEIRIEAVFRLSTLQPQPPFKKGNGR